MILLVCIIIILPISIYCLYQIVNAYALYKSQVKALDENKPKNVLAQRLNLLNAENDNNEKETSVEDETPQDEFNVITEAIQNSFSGYKDYNAKLTSYYKNVRKEDPTGLLDPNALNPENDDW